jgi:hypothetical protein
MSQGSGSEPVWVQDEAWTLRVGSFEARVYSDRSLPQGSRVQWSVRVYLRNLQCVIRDWGACRLPEDARREATEALRRLGAFERAPE